MHNSSGDQHLSGLKLLIERVAALRAPKTGCPWDQEQTHDSLMKYFFEELHEYADALEKHGPHDPKTIEELSDVLLQLALHAQLLSEAKQADLDHVAAICAEKIRQRHPHVFDPAFPRFSSAEEVSANWERIKAYSKASMAKNSGKVVTDSKSSSVLDVPSTLSTLLRASRVGEKAASFGFDFDHSGDVLRKMREELDEIERAKTPEEREDELGDLLFAAAQYARKEKIDPDQALSRGTRKFTQRFERLEKEVKNRGLVWEKLSVRELEAIWQETKHLT